jgi:hypothetical protein
MLSQEKALSSEAWRALRRGFGVTRGVTDRVYGGETSSRDAARVRRADGRAWSVRPCRAMPRRRVEASGPGPCSARAT